MRQCRRSVGILVGVLLCALPAPARAEFSLQIRENGVSGNPGFEIHETGSGNFVLNRYGGVKASDVTWTASAGMIHVTALIDGYKFDLTANSNLQKSPTPSLGVLSLNAQLTNVGGKATTFSYYVADTKLDIPQNKSNTLYLSTSVFTL